MTQEQLKAKARTMTRTELEASYVAAMTQLAKEKASVHAKVTYARILASGAPRSDGLMLDL